MTEPGRWSILGVTLISNLQLKNESFDEMAPSKGKRANGGWGPKQRKKRRIKITTLKKKKNKERKKLLFCINLITYTQLKMP